MENISSMKKTIDTYISGVVPPWSLASFKILITMKQRIEENTMCISVKSKRYGKAISFQKRKRRIYQFHFYSVHGPFPHYM